MSEQTPKRRPRISIAYWVMGTGLLLGVLLVVVSGMITRPGVDAFPRRTIMPGHMTLDLPAGDYEIWYESLSVIDGKAFRSPKPEQLHKVLRCRLADARTQDDLTLVSLYPYKQRFTTSVRSSRSSSGRTLAEPTYDGEQIHTVTVPDSGRYTLYGSPLLTDDADAQYVLMIKPAESPEPESESSWTVYPWGIVSLAGSIQILVSVVGLAVVVVLHMTISIRRFQTQSSCPSKG